MTNYNPQNPSSHLLYYDVNNLYVLAMCEPLPYENFQWKDNIESFDIMSIPDDALEGCILD